MDEPVPFQEPVQASVLLEQLRRRHTDPTTGLRRGRLKAGFSDIDEYLLLGGIQRGSVVGMSSGSDGRPLSREGKLGHAIAGDVADGLDAGRFITLHILAKELLECPFSHASVIDSTGAFPLTLLEQVIRWHVEKESQLSRIQRLVSGIEHTDDTEQSIDSKVNGILERVSITRVFDIEGLWEVVGEIRNGTGQSTVTDETNSVTATAVKDSNNSYSGLDVVAQERGHGGQTDEKPTPRVTPEIMDSEQDDDEDDDDLDTHHFPEEAGPRPKVASGADENNRKISNNAATSQHTGQPLTTELVLVDNMTTLITNLFSRTEKKAAHRLLTQISRTLASLTLSSALTIFLLNTLVKHSPGKHSDNHDRQSSIFAAMTATPSLGVIFDSFVDLHLLCHSLPSSVEDGEKLYGADEERDEEPTRTGNEEHSKTKSEPDKIRNPISKGNQDISYANVVEVLKDECPQPERWESIGDDGRLKKLINREQRWAMFRITEDAGLATSDFGSSRSEISIFQGIGSGHRP